MGLSSNEISTYLKLQIDQYWCTFSTDSDKITRNVAYTNRFNSLSN
jgi:hypothetical protein